jgi:excisionase family DNA binding protein
MTAEEVADYLKISTKSVIRYAIAGKIPSKKFGNRWRFWREAIESLMKPT